MPAAPVLLYIAAGAAVAGAGVSAYSAVEQGRAQDRLAKYNALVAERAAQDKTRDAMLEAKAQRDQSRRALAKTRALYAKAGVVDTTGSPLMVQAEQAGELEKAAVTYEVAGVNEATRLRAQAALDRMAGTAARRGSYLSATGTILSGLGSAASYTAMARKG